MANLVLAIDSFHEEYQRLPGGKIAQIDQTITTAAKKGSPLMAALLGLKVAGNENPKFLSFFECQMAEEKKDGLERKEKTANLFDPWGNPYHVLMNYDNNNQLLDPFDRNTILFDRRALAWSKGPDGKSGTPETDRDNVYSWNRH